MGVAFNVVAVPNATGYALEQPYPPLERAVKKPLKDQYLHLLSRHWSGLS